jgi:PBP1b-binding outer membrane lipoprotein LpoB
MTNYIKHIILISIGTLFIVGCGSSGHKSVSDHGLIDDNTTVETNTTNDTGGGTDTNATTVKSLTLTISTASLNKDYNTTLKVEGTYSDQSTEDLTDKVQWLITPSDAVRIKGNTLIAIKDHDIILRAKLNGTLSNQVKLSIYWEVNGHRLPPEPDPKVNNSTLLGIDSNNNGVRDDVERWIYNKYKDKHPIYIDIAMQAARGYKLVLETPERAKEIREKVNAAQVCNWYYWKDAKYLNEKILVNERIDSSVFGKYFNTKNRQDIYWNYDKLLSGGIYDLPEIEDEKQYCDFNTSKYSKE